MLLSFIFSAAAVYAQTISLSNVQFDLDGCVSPSGTNACYQEAGTTLVQGQRSCNSTTPPSAECLIGVNAQYYQNVIGCLTEGCWNRAYSCEYQYMLGVYELDIIVSDSFPGANPPFWVIDYDGLPGSCVCNIRATLAATHSDARNFCTDIENFVPCDCCSIGNRLAYLQELCPANSLTVVGLPTTLNSDWIPDVQSHCQWYQQDDWLDMAEQQCSAYGQAPLVNGSTPYLNPLSLPADWPATAPLSDTPGSLTALSQYNNVSATVTWSWGSNIFATYTLSSANMVVTGARGGSSGASSASASASPRVTTVPGATTTINGQATTLAASVVTQTAGATRVIPSLGMVAAVMMML